MRAAAVLGRVACLLLLPGGAGAANQVSPEPPSQEVELGATAELALEIAFDDATIGGGIRIEPDPGLAFVSFEFEVGFPDDPALRLVCPDPADSRCDDFSGPGALVAFGSSSGISGSHRVGTLRLRADGGGSHPVHMSEDEPQGLAGPFQPVPGGSFATPSFSDATVAVLVQVPALSTGPVLLLAVLLAVTGSWMRSASRGRSSPGLR